MGYRLHASIPNVNGFNNDLELGKQYDYAAWDGFNDKWFGAENDTGFVRAEDLLEFYDDFLDANENATKYPLYNVDVLKEMIDYAVKNNYVMYFVSY